MDTSALVNSIGLILIPVLVPLVIGAFKKFVTDKVPGAVLPIIAAVLGPLFDWGISAIAGIPPSGALVGVALGLAGVGLREVKEGAVRAIKEVGGP